MKRIKFAVGEYYHVFNRGVDKREIFGDNFDYIRFLRSLNEFNQVDPILSLYIQDQLKSRGIGIRPLRDKKLVDLVAYCLISNHFHLIIKQKKEGGISEFMKRVGVGFTGYFNHKYKRSGVLFQGKFKAAHINSQDKLSYLSAYVNGNYIIHNGDDKQWKFSSLSEYLNRRKNNLCDSKIILREFKNLSEYKNYVLRTANEIRKMREEMKNYIIE